MKNSLRSITALLCLFVCVKAQAVMHQVTTSLNTTTVITVLKLSTSAGWATLSNPGTVAINLSLDGGGQYINQPSGVQGTEPVTGATGLCTQLGPGQTIYLDGPTFANIPIRAIAATSGTCYLNISTNDPLASFPSN